MKFVLIEIDDQVLMLVIDEYIVKVVEYEPLHGIFAGLLRGLLDHNLVIVGRVITVLLEQA